MCVFVCLYILICVLGHILGMCDVYNMSSMNVVCKVRVAYYSELVEHSNETLILEKSPRCGSYDF